MEGTPVSTNHIHLCKKDKKKIAIKFFEMIFNTSSQKCEVCKLKIKKTLGFWQSYFATKLPKENIDILCSDSINNSELEDRLTSDVLNFI